jgi:hypothetical protein
MAKHLAAIGEHERAAGIFHDLSREWGLPPARIKELTLLAAQNYELAAGQNRAAYNHHLAGNLYYSLACLKGLSLAESKDAFIAAARNCELASDHFLAGKNWENAGKKSVQLRELEEAQAHRQRAFVNYVAARAMGRAVFVGQDMIRHCHGREQKITIAKESANIIEQAGDKVNSAYFLGEAAKMTKNEGRLAEAIELYIRTGTMLEDAGDKQAAAFAYCEAAKLLDEQPDQQQAAGALWLKSGDLLVSCNQRSAAHFSYCRAAEHTADPDEKFRLRNLVCYDKAGRR